MDAAAPLLPVLMPLAPAATLLARFPKHLTELLAALGVPDPVITDELSRMLDIRLAKTANRSVVGIMNEFTFLLKNDRQQTQSPDLTALAVVPEDSRTVIARW